MNLKHSVVAICRKPRNSKDLAGTGTLLTPNLVLTCSHIFGTDSLSLIRKNFVADFQGENYPLRRVICSKLMDLCCLEMDRIPGSVPLKMARTRHLEDLSLFTAGFNEEMKEHRLNVIRNLKVDLKQESADEEDLQFAQMDGGVSEHFSGAPVCFDADDDYPMFGIMQLGGAGKAKSRLIAVDRIAAFLKEEGLVVPVTAFQPPPKARPPSKNSEGDISNNAEINNGSHINLNQTINMGGK